MGYTYYNPLKVWLDPASIADVVSYMQKYLSENPIKDTEEINQIIAEYIAVHPELIGGVQSVNGETGEVVLTASDINTTGTTTIQAVLTSLSSQISEITQTVSQNTDDITDLKSALQFIEKKNLFAEITTGKYSIAWNVGDTVTFGDGANYAYGIADVEGLNSVTINLISMSDAYSFFTDAQNKKIAKSVDNRVGTSRVYNVPSGAKYFYVSSNDRTRWIQYGFVMLAGTDDIATSPVSISLYPYDTTVYFSDNLKLSTGITVGEALETASKVYHVEKDGSGDYDSLVTAIQEAVKYDNSIVYVGAGTWNIIDEFGTAYMEAVSSNTSTWGLRLKNRIHLIGTAKTVIKAVNVSGSTNFENIKEYFSVFNAGEKGFTLENISIEDENIRYSVHDDRGGFGPEPYTNKYIRCSMIHKNGKYSDCIGGGIGENCAVEIRGCYFEGESGRPRLAYYHGNNKASVTNAQANIIVCDNYFAQDGTFQLTNYGNSTTVSKAFVSNNSFGTAPSVTDGSSPSPIIVNMELVEWNNEVRT